MDATAVRLSLKKTVTNCQPIVTDTAAITSDVTQDNNNDESINDTSAMGTMETSFPRRSLRKQGIGPLEEGLPYYESARSIKRRISNADDKTDEETNGHAVNDSECHDSEGDEGKDTNPDIDTEHNLSSETMLNTSCVTGKCQSFMVKNLLDLKSPQDSIPPVNFSTPTHPVSTNGPVIPNDHPTKPANTPTTSNTSQQKTSTEQGNLNASIHASELMETNGSRVAHELPVVNNLQLKQLFHYAVRSTDRTAVSHLEKLHNCLEHAIFRHRMEKNKNILLEVSIHRCMHK